MPAHYYTMLWSETPQIILTMLCEMQAVAKALREREQALLTVQALENELGTKRRGISSLEESGQQVRCLNRPPC